MLDLFAGSGALGLEALSRGATAVEFIEIAPKSIEAIGRNATTLGAGDRVRVHRADALRFAAALGAHAYDVAFADPPYGEDMATRLAEAWLRTPFARVLGVEHRVNERLPGSEDRRRYGDTVLTFYRDGG